MSQVPSNQDTFPGSGLCLDKMRIEDTVLFEDLYDVQAKDYWTHLSLLRSR
jgi:hypothetical protein